MRYCTEKSILAKQPMTVYIYILILIGIKLTKDKKFIHDLYMISLIFLCFYIEGERILASRLPFDNTNKYLYGIFKNSVTCDGSVVFSRSSSNKTDHHDITEILLKVALNTIKQTNNIEKILPCPISVCLIFVSILAPDLCINVSASLMM